MKRVVAVFVAVILATMPVIAVAATIVVTPADVSETPGAWHPANERSGGTSVITTTQADAHGGGGSLEQTLPAPTSPSPKTDFQIFSADTTFANGAGLQAPSGGFGLLSEISALSFDWYRDSASTAAEHLTPALRVLVWDPADGTNGSSYMLVWEGVYNGYPAASGPVPTDEWVAQDVVAGNFWRIPQYIDGAWTGISACNSGPNTCYYFNRGLDDWGFSAGTVVIGLEVGLGSGWNGTYHSFADYVTLGFGENDPVVWDFEAPTNNCVFDTAGTTMTLMGDCWTTETILVPGGFTLDGNGYTITALDPEGGHFLGAVVSNADDEASVINLTVTAQELANACDAADARLAGIKLAGASGIIAYNTIIGINQGASGCQEGNAIEVRNPPFDGSSDEARLSVEIHHNTIDDYQKTGIVANGNVDASIHHNLVGDSATQANLAANGIQLGFGATGSIMFNTIYGNQWLQQSNWTATAVLIYQVTSATVSMNNIRGNSDVGIDVSSNNVTLDNNKVFDEGEDAGIEHLVPATETEPAHYVTYDIGIGSYGESNILTNNKVRGFDTPYEGLSDPGNNKVIGQPAN